MLKNQNFRKNTENGFPKPFSLLTNRYFYGIIYNGDFGRLAQLGERLPYKQDVGGSIPSPPTIFTLLFLGA